MINVTSMLKLENEELKEALNLSMKNIDCIYTEENLIQSPYNYKNLELSGLSGATFDFLARIRIIKKIGRTDISEVISIPHAVVRELKENGLKNFSDNENDIDIPWIINRFDYITSTLNKYLLGEYDIRPEIVQIGFDLACIEALYRSSRKNNFLYTEITPVFKRDMILMLKNFNEEFIVSDKILKANSEVIFNPTFGSNMTNVRADGDIIIDKCLIDLKTRKKLDIKSDIKQLIIYNTLNKINHEFVNRFGLNIKITFEIEKIASYNPRFKGVFLVDTDQIDPEGESMLTEYISDCKWMVR